MAKGKLSEYSAKRSFKATPEPAAAVPEARSGPLLFVIQQHSATRLHYDFRLECDGVLKSWAVPKGPSLDPADKRLAVPTEDHPFDYASFEGVIPPGQYGAGEVIVWDCGVYSPDEEKDVGRRPRRRPSGRSAKGWRKESSASLLRGEKVKGSFALVRTSRGKDWLLIKHKDRFVSKDDVTARNRSVLSGIAVDEMKAMPVQRIAAANLVPAGKREAMPDNLEPMHAELADAPFNKPDWMWEPKLDGYRVLAFLERRQSYACGRGADSSWPRRSRELAAALARAGRRQHDPRRRDRRLRRERQAVVQRAAEPLSAEGRARHRGGRARAPRWCSMPSTCCTSPASDLRKAPYADRRRYLAQCLLPSPLVQLVHAADDGVELYSAALASGFEGVIGKRKQSKYESGKRSASWIKVKSTRSAEFVVGGYTKGKGARAPLGALLVGYWEGKKLRYASHVGSGFDDQSLAQVRARLEPLRRKACPFADKPELNAPTTWVEPQVVAEVRFQGWTDDGSLRAPVFLRLRDDVDPKSVRRGNDRASASPKPKPSSGSEIDDVLSQLEKSKASGTITVGAHAIKLSNLDRVYWPADPALKQPALTKRDLLRYLAQVSPFMLPHLADRPLTMIRMPDGINGQRFFQKHWTQARPSFVETITVFSGHKDESHEYLLCNNLPTLLWLAQSGTLEFHVWHSRARPAPDCAVQSTDYSSSLDALESSVLNYPDYVVFDIDPYIYSGKEAPGDEPELNTVAFEKGKEVAFRLRELLNSMSLDPIVKTSGKTGLHVFLPIRRTIDFDAAREVSERVGRHLMRLHPKDITLEWSVPKRTGKIFMDYNMNVRGKTLNVAYSPRGAMGAPVSMPLTLGRARQGAPARFQDDERGGIPGAGREIAGAMRSSASKASRALGRAKA